MFGTDQAALQLRYEVLLTLYGPGGSYRSDTGRVIMLTRPDGSFRRPIPHGTVIHEIVHIGIQRRLVRRYRLSHWEKERLVDLICARLFRGLLPTYRLQRRGDRRIDAYVQRFGLRRLPKAVRQYVRDHPRSGQRRRSPHHLRWCLDSTSQSVCRFNPAGSRRSAISQRPVMVSATRGTVLLQEP